MALPRASQPSPLTPFLGRERELQAAAEQVCLPQVRLMTLAGPPGIGKTTFARRLASEVEPAFDSVVYVPLETVTDPSLVVNRIAAALGLSESGNPNLANAIGASLGARKVLLVLDNFEQVVDAAPEIAGLLELAGQTTCLVTSRELLDVRGEHEFPLPPLQVPDMSRFEGRAPAELLAGVSQYSAVRLLAERARALWPDFELTAGNVSQVVALCRRLNGIPLALELAASRLRVVSLEELEAGLEAADPTQRFEFLGSGRRDSPTRHRSLWSAIDWSYDLLSDQEKRLFVALGIFRGGWTLEAVESLLEGVLGARGHGALDALSTLSAKSLIYRIESDGKTERWFMLQPLRDYAVARMRADDTERRALHLWLFEWLKGRLSDPLEQAEANPIEEIEAEHDNFRVLLDWALAEGEPEIAAKLAESLWRFWLARNHLFEGRRWLARILEMPDPPEGALRASLLYGAATLAREQGDLAAVREHVAAALDILRSDTDLEAEAGVAIANLSAGVARALCMEGRFDEAGHLADEAIRLLRRDGRGPDLAEALTVGAISLQLRGRPGEAVVLFEESLAVYRQAGDRLGGGNALDNLGRALAALGDTEQGRKAAAEALGELEALGNQRGVAKSLAVLGDIACTETNFREAVDLLLRAVRILRDVGDWVYTSYCTLNLAIASAGRHDYRRAAVLAAAAESFAGRRGGVMFPFLASRHELLIATLRKELGRAAFERARAEGLCLTVDGLIELVESGEAAPEAPGSGEGLTTRETEVLELVTRGLTDAEVAEKLFLSKRTVHSHLRSIYGKLGVKTRTAAARHAIEHKLVESIGDDLHPS